MRDADPSPPPTHFAATARRELRVFGAPVELALLPGRAARPGRPGAERPAFRPDLGLRIAATEAIHAGPEFVVTPNKFPFARAQTVLWSRRPLREPDAEFLHSALSWTDQRGGSLLLNSVGAAASIPRAHAHHTDEAMPFLPELGEQPFAAPWLPEVAGASYVQKAAPFALLGVRGDARARAEATAALQMLRMTPAVSVVAPSTPRPASQRRRLNQSSRTRSDAAETNCDDAVSMPSCGVIRSDLTRWWADVSARDRPAGAG